MKADSLEGLESPAVEGLGSDGRPIPTYIERDEIHRHGVRFALMIGIALITVAVTCSKIPSTGSLSEGALVVLVIASGFAGGLIHSATSLAAFAGNRQLLQSWMLWFYLRGPVGALLALIVYLGYRGGIFSDYKAITQQSCFVIGFVSGLAGLFSKQVSDKLSDLVDVLFASSQASKRADALGSADQSQADAAKGPATPEPDETIRRVQHQLRLLDYLPAEGTAGSQPGVGVFDAVTKDALQRFLLEQVGTDASSIVGEESDVDFWPRVEALLGQALNK